MLDGVIMLPNEASFSGPLTSFSKNRIAVGSRRVLFVKNMYGLLAFRCLQSCPRNWLPGFPSDLSQSRPEDTANALFAHSVTPIFFGL